MDFPPSPPVLYLEDDHDHEQVQYPEMSRSFIPSITSTEVMHRAQKKRKLTNPNLMTNPSAVHWPKRNRIDPFDQRLAAYSHEPGSEPEPIILDPDDYVIEEPDTHSFRAFDWTIEPRRMSFPLRPKPIFPGTTIVDAPMSLANTPHYVTDRAERVFQSSMNNTTDKGHLPQRKLFNAPATQPPIPLPLPTPTSLLVRPATKRGRPLKASRIARTSPPSAVRQPPEPVLAPTTARASAPSSSTFPPPSEYRRQLLHGTGIFSAFHDSKYYRCNICKFKSVTSSTLLQHLFTHVFFCQHCAFYTYSHYQLSQHMFEKHELNLIEDISDPLDPKAFDLLYLTRCADGTFALCMDAAAPSSSKYSHDQQLILSSTTLNDQPLLKATKKSSTKEDRNELVVSEEKRDTTAKPSSSERSRVKEKSNRNYLVMKHRRFYSLKRSPALHSITLEYNICRERMIRHMARTQDIIKRRANQAKSDERRLIDEISHCLRTTVNQIVDSEENSAHPSLICPLPNQTLSSIFEIDDLTSVTDALKLTNKSARSIEEKTCCEAEHTVRQSDNQIFAFSSPTNNSNEQTIIASLHSSLTNGDSCFVHTKFEKLPLIHDNTHRFFKAYTSEPSQLSTSKPSNKSKTATPTSTVAVRPTIPKPSQATANLPTATRVDRNNNSITSSKSKLSSSVPNIIVLD